MNRPKMGRPRGSSNLGADPRGDTGAPSLATLQMLTPRSAPTEDHVKKPHSKRRKAKSRLRRYYRTSLKYTWLNPLIITIAILTAYFSKPGQRNPLHKAIFLSYNEGPAYPGGPNRYGKGRADIAFVSFFTIVLFLTR